MTRLVSRQDVSEDDESMALEEEPGEHELDEFVPDEGGPLPQSFVAGGRVGTVPVGDPDSDVAGIPHTFKLAKRVTGPDAEKPAGDARPGHREDHAHPEAGDGADVPRAFISGGRTGNVAWAGGGGAGPHGNQPVGSLQWHMPPMYSSRSNGLFEQSEAWVAPWSARVLVIRSWVGSNAGDQGNGWYVTPAAAARLDAHEAMHVASTQGHYQSFIDPAVNLAHSTREWAYTQAEARASVRSIVDWNAAISSFQTNDTADNTPMGTVDTNDLASGTYVVNIGPGTVSGTAFTNRLKTPSEAAPPA